ncbi:hypothetical protein PICMEDRAFT_15888 [Pichia membranifaciens NRRL Y-2026]|uniref:Autophagy protein 5 n=1 Tax=Pichia membranifaciens NRRL Y-2026 TaxID=763406 RepID=A0A1E3NPT7_9ASCO|nr:hypothetical protein PICMEDRAFT_15888 [Pichia membranifaciens NRRL Y-2026]ODQ48046.1 hypothetical protein PICMEDRAFT_15888 [Pichia membranifaciens NRRL Y-2026]
MPGENSILSKIWSSQICCKVNYKTNTTNSRQTFYLLVHRNSYLYRLLAEIFDFFNIPHSKISQAWFEDARTGQIVDWNLPLDVSYELYTDMPDRHGYFDIDLRLKFISSSQSSQSIKAFQQQLASTASTSPASGVVKLLEKHWRNIIKESCYILNGSSNIIMSMSLENSKEFWNAVLLHDYKSYEKHFRKLLPSSPMNVPLKLYIVENKLLKFVNQPNLNRMFPRTPLHEISLQNLVDSVLTLKSHREHPNRKPLQFIAHGVQLPPESPLNELYTAAKYFDSFLHIVIKL